MRKHGKNAKLPDQARRVQHIHSIRVVVVQLHDHILYHPGDVGDEAVVLVDACLGDELCFDALRCDDCLARTEARAVGRELVSREFRGDRRSLPIDDRLQDGQCGQLVEGGITLTVAIFLDNTSTL